MTNRSVWPAAPMQKEKLLQQPASLAALDVRNVRRTVRQRRSQSLISVHTLIMISVQTAAHVQKCVQNMPSANSGCIQIVDFKADVERHPPFFKI